MSLMGGKWFLNQIQLYYKQSKIYGKYGKLVKLKQLQFSVSLAAVTSVAGESILSGILLPKDYLIHKQANFLPASL